MRRPQPEPEPPDALYAQAIALALTERSPSTAARAFHALNVAYWLAVLLLLSWFLGMALERDLPVELGERRVVNAGGQVARGARLVVRAERIRLKVCELTRQWAIVDASGRRFDFAAEHFDAYGPKGDATDATGPLVPVEAAAGPARFLSTLAWSCNPLQRAAGWPIVLVQPPLPFVIVGSGEPP